MKANKYVLEAVIFLTYAVFGMSWAAVGSFLPLIMKEVGLSLADVGFLSTSVSFAKIFGPALASLLALRIGFKKAFLLASLLISLGMLTPLANSFASLLGVRFLMGIGGAMVVVYFTPLVMQWFTEKEWPVVNGINAVAINTGMALALFATPQLVSSFGNWRFVMLVYGCLSLLLAVIWAMFGTEAKIKTADSGNAWQNYVQAAKMPAIWALIFSYSGILTFYLTLFTYYPTFYKSSPLFPDAPWLAQIPTITMMTGIVGALLGIVVAKKITRKIPLLRYSGLVLLLAVAGLSFAKTPLLILASAVLTGLSLFIWTAAFTTIPLELPGMTVRLVSFAMSLFWSVSYFTATVGVWFFGYLADATGSFSSSVLFATLACATLFVGTFFLQETGRKTA